MRTAALGGKTFDGREIAICYGDSPVVNAIFKELRQNGGVDGENKFASIEVLESVGGRGRRAKFEFIKPEAKQKKGKV